MTFSSASSARFSRIARRRIRRIICSSSEHIQVDDFLDFDVFFDQFRLFAIPRNTVQNQDIFDRLVVRQRGVGINTAFPDLIVISSGASSPRANCARRPACLPVKLISKNEIRHRRTGERSPESGRESYLEFPCPPREHQTGARFDTASVVIEAPSIVRLAIVGRSQASSDIASARLSVVPARTHEHGHRREYPKRLRRLPQLLPRRGKPQFQRFPQSLDRRFDSGHFVEPPTVGWSPQARQSP